MLSAALELERSHSKSVTCSARAEPNSARLRRTACSSKPRRSAAGIMDACATRLAMVSQASSCGVKASPLAPTSARYAAVTD